MSGPIVMAYTCPHTVRDANGTKAFNQTNVTEVLVGPGCGHMPQECGDKILAVLRGFLSRAKSEPS
jgi:hypothetical protein